MKNKTQLTLLKNWPYLLLFILTVVMLYSCDTFEEDRMVEATKLDQKKQIVIPPNTTAVVDFTTLVNVRGAVRADITGSPSLGTLSELSGNLYKYTPTANTTGREAISFDIYGSANNYVLSDTLVIIVSSDAPDSCFLRAVEDRFYIKGDTTTLLDVLKNDNLCETVDISILKQPDHGTVQLLNSSIRYTTAGYSGTDEFVYRLTAQGDSLLTSDGLVVLQVGDSTCQLKVNNDSYQFDRTITNQYLDVLSNDVFCGQNQTVSILQDPQFGTAVFDSRKLLDYEPTTSDTEYIDSLVYEVCEGGNCGQGQVIINVYENQCDSLIAFDDRIDISDTTITAAIYIDVTANDTYCGAFNLNLETSPAYGTISIDSVGFYYDPNELMIKDDEFSYRICLDDNVTCDEATVSIIRED